MDGVRELGVGVVQGKHLFSRRVLSITGQLASLTPTH